MPLLLQKKVIGKLFIYFNNPTQDATNWLTKSLISKPLPLKNNGEIHVTVISKDVGDILKILNL